MWINISKIVCLGMFKIIITLCKNDKLGLIEKELKKVKKRRKKAELYLRFRCCIIFNLQGSLLSAVLIFDLPLQTAQCQFYKFVPRWLRKISPGTCRTSGLIFWSKPQKTVGPTTLYNNFMSFPQLTNLFKIILVFFLNVFDRLKSSRGE